jgi:hypothetical protein
MAGFEKVSAISMTVGAAIAQYKFLEMGNAGIVAAAGAVGDDIVGISLEARSAADITAGNTKIPVAVPDGCKCLILSGAAIDISAAVVQLTSDSSGRAIAVAAATDRVQGYALQSATAADQVIEMLFLKAGSHRDA